MNDQQRWHGTAALIRARTRLLRNDRGGRSVAKNDREQAGMWRACVFLCSETKFSS